MGLHPIVIKKCKVCGKVTNPYQFCSLSCAKQLYLELTDLIPNPNYYQTKSKQ